MTSTDDEYGELLMRPLDHEPPQASTVSVAKALAEGRRLRRRRTIKLYCAGTATVIAMIAAGTLAVDPGWSPGGSTAAQRPAHGAPPAVAADGTLPTSCTVQPLAVPAGRAMSQVHGADPTGRYAVGMTGPVDPKVIFWDEGRPTTVDMPGNDPWLQDVNRHGVAVGTSYDDAGGFHAWLYRDGKVSELAGPHDSAADNINAAGMITGHVYQGTDLYPVFWSSPEATARALQIPPGAHAVVRDIDDSGLMVGHVDTRPWLWQPDGTGQALPLPHGVTAVSQLWIRGDWVSGNDSDTGTGVRWNLRTGEVITTEVTSTRGMSSARPISAGGWMVANDRDRRPFLTAPGQSPLPLPLLSEERSATAEPSNYAVELSDDGRTIYGHAFDRTAKDRAAVVWRCS
jgi:uncharacterized membrane protein